MRRESIETASKIKKTGDYEDYLESLDLYDRKKVKKRKDPFKDVPEIVESEQEIFGRKYWSWLFRQSLYSLCSGPLIHLSCFISGMPEISKERKRSKCGAAVALVAWILLGGGMPLFYDHHGREIAAIAGVLHNHKLIEGISTMDAYKANALMAYGMRGFLGWFIILTIIFAFVGKKVYFNSFLFGKFELRQEADQSMPEDTTKKEVHLTKKERKRYERIHQKLQDNNGDRAIRHDESDQFLAAVSKNLAYMHDDEEDDDTDEYPETKSPAKSEPVKTDHKRNKNEEYDDIDLSKIEIADKPTGFKRPDGSQTSSENGSYAEKIQKEEKIPAASRMETKKVAADQERADADSCRWQVKMIDDTRYWICSCGTKEKYYDIENQKFCPYCGKKITF